MRRALWWVAIVLVILVIADQAARAYVERRLEARVEDAFAASAADVQLPGFPVLLALVRGEVARLGIEIVGAVAGDPPVRLERVRADLEGAGIGMRGDAAPVTVVAGSFEAVVSGRELGRLVERERPGWKVELSDGALEASGTVEGAAIDLRAETIVDGDALLVVTREIAAGDRSAREVASAFDLRLPLPPLPGGLTVTGAEIRGDDLLLTGPVAQLDLPG